MMSEYKINILPFNILNEEVDISFSLQEKEGYSRIFVQSLPKNFPNKEKEKIYEDKFTWWIVGTVSDDITIPVNLIENNKFAKHYFNKILYMHFDEQGILINRNFIGDSEVYLKDQSFEKEEYSKYNRFSLRFDHNNLLPDTSLLVSYEGNTFILKKI